MGKSKVFFIPIKDADDIGAVNANLKQLISASGILGFISSAHKIGVKVHFGEDGNTGFVRPSHIRVICDALAAKGAKAVIADANTLYRGKRLNSKDHKATARKHGFTKKVVGADIFIPDDNIAKEITEVDLGAKFIKTAHVAKFFIDADSLITVSHFKGHILTGFGGAIKNVGMGCATRKGKLAQHCDVAPVVYTDKCIGCGACAKICPSRAIAIIDCKSVVDKTRCIGCASCLAACPTMAMFIDFGAGEAVQHKMAEYAYAVLKDKPGKAAFFNFAVRINKECDCWGSDNPRIGPDVGILASLDPVSIDKASFDLIKEACGRDIFAEAHPGQDGMKQLEYAQALGLGSVDYELVKYKA